MLDHDGQSEAADDGGDALVPTPTDDDLPRRYADFATMPEALDYVGAEQARASISTITAPSWSASIPIAELRADALADAHRLIARGVEARRPDRADRRDRARVRRLVLRRALCRRLAGAAAAADLVRRRANPISTSSRVQLKSSDPALLFYPARARRDGRRGRRGGRRRGRRLGRASQAGRRRSARCPRPKPDDIAYLQYSSGSTRFPHGVAVTHQALLANLAAHADSMNIGAGRPRRFLAAFLPRHGPGRLHALDGRQPDVGRLSQDRGFRPPPARLARPDHPQRRQCDELFADLRLRHLRAPRVEPDERRRALRSVALAGRRQRRRHDPARRHAGLRRRLRAGRLRRQQLPAELRPRRGDARGHGHAAGRGHRRRAGRGDPARRRRRGRARPAAALPLGRQLRQAGARHGGRDPRRRRQHAGRARDRQGLLPRHLGHGRLFPRRGGDRTPASTPTAGSTPATWAICPTAISTSSAAPRT